MSRVAIVGGGITGLSAAYYLSKLPASLVSKIVVYEGSQRVGGWVESTRCEDGSVFERGPRSLRGAGISGHNTLVLAEELGLSEDVVAVTQQNPAARNRFVYVNNELCALPSGPMGVLKKSAPFSKSLARLAWKEPFTAAEIREDDTVYNFFRRRFGEEIAKYACDPLCRGVYAGDCRELSVKACFPDIFDYEQKYGSVVKGAFKAPRKKNTLEASALAKRNKEERWAMWSFKQGLSQLPEALEARLGEDPRVELLVNAPADTLTFQAGKAQVKSAGEQEKYDYVFAACSAPTLSGILGAEHPALAGVLSKVRSATVGVVSLQYPGNDILPRLGFGHLVPSTEPSKVLGVLYESIGFPEHNDDEQETTKVTCMMGGTWYRQLFGEPGAVSEEELGQVAQQAVAEQLGIQANPLRTLSRLNQDCIPQYTLGHTSRMDTIKEYLRHTKLPMSVIGASYWGVSVNDCIYHARQHCQQWAEKR